MANSSTLSRRDFFSRFLPITPESPSSESESAVPLVAIIQGRHCLAYQRSFCSVCVERCPKPGAILGEKGIPRIVAEKCTGCGICHDLCPAPVNAILMAQQPQKKA